jgi:hypothetical protein
MIQGFSWFIVVLKTMIVQDDFDVRDFHPSFSFVGKVLTRKFS